MQPTNPFERKPAEIDAVKENRPTWTPISSAGPATISLPNGYELSSKSDGSPRGIGDASAYPAGASTSGRTFREELSSSVPYSSDYTPEDQRREMYTEEAMRLLEYLSQQRGVDGASVELKRTIDGVTQAYHISWT